MRYAINFDKTVNQLVPHYLGGRKLVLLLQALARPLQPLNDAFVSWAKRTRIEASMTSQVFKFEWFLNDNFKKYFSNPSERISIQNSAKLGYPIYHQIADIEETDHMVLYNESESQAANDPLYYENENTGSSNVSFVVCSPAINEGLITQDSYLAKLSHYIDKYKLACKTYTITFND